MANLSELLKTKKLRLTNSRKLVYKALQSANTGLTAKQIFSLVDDGKKITDLVSIYRNLSVFCELGVAHKLQDGRYSICKHEPEKASHVHLIMNCGSCGKVTEIDAHTRQLCDVTKRLATLATGFKKVSAIHIQGRCWQCDL